MRSPHDAQARHSWEREVDWAGHEAHLTETRHARGPNLVAHVETTPSTSPGPRALDAAHGALSEKNLLPGKRFVDAGYVGPMGMATARNRHGVDLFGPMPRDGGRQATERRARQGRARRR